jgi:hypothetical protein
MEWMAGCLDGALNLRFPEKCTKRIHTEAVLLWHHSRSCPTNKSTGDHNNEPYSWQDQDIANPLYLRSPTFLLGHGQLGETYSGHPLNVEGNKVITGINRLRTTLNLVLSYIKTISKTLLAHTTVPREYIIFLKLHLTIINTRSHQLM